MKHILILLASPILLFFVSCGGNKTEEKSTIPGMTEVSIKVNSNDFNIIVPDSTKGILEVTEQPWGATEIKVGPDFHISIEENDGDVSLMKTDITGNEVFKLQRYLKDEPALLFWESKNENMPDSRFHFYAIVKAGTSTFVIKDVERLEAYNEAAVQTMVDASQTLKGKEAAKPNS